METLVEQARRLSSGTIATLTGERYYDRIDAVRLEFVEFCETVGGRYDTWQAAWQAWRAAR